MQGMLPHPLAHFLGKFGLNLAQFGKIWVKFGQNLGKFGHIWVKFA